LERGKELKKTFLERLWRTQINQEFTGEKGRVPRAGRSRDLGNGQPGGGDVCEGGSSWSIDEEWEVTRCIHGTEGKGNYRCPQQPATSFPKKSRKERVTSGEGDGRLTINTHGVMGGRTCKKRLVGLRQRRGQR